MPVGEERRKRDGEIEAGMRCLTGLDAGRQIRPGDQVEARTKALVVRHEFRIHERATHFYRLRSDVDRLASSSRTRCLRRDSY